jgi:hypothetical protein
VRRFVGRLSERAERLVILSGAKDLSDFTLRDPSLRSG